MDWLNYHHLLYFWVVAKEGSIVAAGKQLRLASPTISGQIRLLEQALGEKLFVHSGRKLVLTDEGRLVFRYADEIFSLGSELMDTIKGAAKSGRPLRLVVGVADGLPPSLTRRFLEPAFALPQPLRVICRSDKAVTELVGELALHTIDVVLSDGPAASSPIRAFSHPLGECGTTFFAAPKIARALRRGFPRSLHDAPFLLPGARSAARRALEQWFAGQGLKPRVLAELDDGGLAKDFGRYGMGVFAAPDVIEAEVVHDYAVQIVGRAESARQQFYAISVERKIKHPAVAAIREAARQKIFTGR